MKISSKLQDSDIPFDDYFKTLLNKSAQYAKLDKEIAIRPTHLCYAILNDDVENIIITTLQQMNVDLSIFEESLESNRKKFKADKKINLSDIEISSELESIILKTYNKIKNIKNYFEVSDMFFGLLTTKNELTEIFIENAIEYSVFKETFDEVNQYFDLSNTELEQEQVVEAPVTTTASYNYPNHKSNNKPINYLINLNEKYTQKKLSRCIGREKEILNIERTLNKVKKRNVMLVGKSGIGKTNIVEGLVEKIMTNQTSIELKNKIVYSLDLNALVSNTVWRGQFEERVKELVAFLLQNKNVILFVDEIHNIIGAGNNQGSMDLANILKPHLTSGEILLIGATTLEEYKIYVERDKALSRRFSIQHIEELNIEDTKKILISIKEQFEIQHNCIFTEEGLSIILNACEKYYPNKTFPDKAIDMLDEIGAYFKASQGKRPEIVDLELQLENLKAIRQEAIEKNIFDVLPDIQKKKEFLIREINTTINNNKVLFSPSTLTTIQIKEIIKTIYGLRYFWLDGEITEYFDEIKKDIKSQLKNQDSIVDDIVDKIQTKQYFKDLETIEKPLSFIFVGNTGTGKTYLSKLLAKHVYQNKIKILNCELFQERHSVSNLIGSPKGYVGSESGSDLFEFLKYNPESVIVLDEIEKAHKDFAQTFLSICDEGKITDKDGNIIDFSKAIIIFTSNIGTQKLNNNNIIGFNVVKNEKNILEKEIKSYFSSELLNRMDEVYYFNSKINYEELLIAELEKLIEYTKKQIVLTDSTKTEILESCNNATYGVRELQRQITKKIKEKLVKQLKYDGVLNI